MLKKSCYILVFVLSFIKMDLVFSMEDEVSSCIDEDWEKKHPNPPVVNKNAEERPSTPPKLKMKRTFKKKKLMLLLLKK
ncbi:hypothetical protein QM565_01245 [Geitlerinema splendidum]|nr:hypothetical protein [Geitlerinema splendidum]